MSSQLKINRGTTYSINFTFQRNGAAASLVGATVRFTAKSTEYSTDTTDADAVIIKNITTGASDGTAIISINPADTASLVPGKYFYDIKVQLPSGEIYKADEGTIKLDGSPTNRLS